VIDSIFFGLAIMCLFKSLLILRDARRLVATAQAHHANAIALVEKAQKLATVSLREYETAVAVKAEFTERG
jgi:hypothetical protein